MKPPSATPKHASGPPRRRRARRRWCPDAISGGNTQAINYFIAQKYVDAIGLFATSPNAKTILFPVEATQLMGTLGGIGELAKEVLGGAEGKDSDKTVPAVRRPGPFEQRQGG